MRGILVKWVERGRVDTITWWIMCWTMELFAGIGLGVTGEAKLGNCGSAFAKKFPSDGFVIQLRRPTTYLLAGERRLATYFIYCLLRPRFSDFHTTHDG